MSVDDRLAIQKTIARYSYTYDGLDADGYANVFTDDGVFEVFLPGQTSPAVRVESRRAIRDWAARRLQARRERFGSRHYQTGTIFDELTADSAVTRTLVLVTHQHTGEAAPRIAHTGVYHDRWRRTDEGWRIAHRAAHLDQQPPK